MAKAIKFNVIRNEERIAEFNQQEEVQTPIFTIAGNNTLTLQGNYDPCEFMFQFDDEEPVVFATTGANSPSQELTMKVINGPGGAIFFNDKHGKRFKIFARQKPTLKKV